MRSRKKGTSFKKAVTIGRQNLFLGTKELENLLRDFGHSASSAPGLKWEQGVRPYAEPLFEFLGAEVLDSLDASDYEDATIVHDLNLPLPANLQHGFDVVCELGSLEHVFNFPTAMGNCLRLVKQGGHFIWVTPANNNFGHGFYQFSPELAYRVLSPVNGFEIEELVAVEYGPRRRWYSVADPVNAHDRVQLINPFPVYMMVRAKRISEVEPFLTPPQQSDYFSTWEASAEKPADAPPPPATRPRWKDLLIESSPRLVRILQSLQTSGFNRRFSFKNPRSFTPLDKNG